MVNNVWNMRQSASGGVRVFDSARPWYRFASALLEQVPTGGDALDVGCGVGEFLEYLSGRGFQVQGIDGNAAQIAVVTAHGQRGQVVDLEGALPFADGTFELVTCLEVLEHIAQAELLLRELARILKPHGFLLLSTPNFAFLNHRLHYLRGAPPSMEGTHLRFFTRTRLENTLAKAGFRVSARNSFGVLPVVSGIETRLLRTSPKQVRMPLPLESLLASDLVFLARRAG